MTALFRKPRRKGPRLLRQVQPGLFTPRLEPFDIEGPTTPPAPTVSPDGPDVPEVVTGQLITSAWGSDVADDLAELHADIAALSVGGGSVPAIRSINTTVPLSGGGDLSADRTLAVADFTTSTRGTVPASGGGTAFFLRADGDWCTHLVAKATAPTAADFGLAAIPVGAVWIQTP